MIKQKPNLDFELEECDDVRIQEPNLDDIWMRRSHLGLKMMKSFNTLVTSVDTKANLNYHIGHFCLNRGKV